MVRWLMATIGSRSFAIGEWTWILSRARSSPRIRFQGDAMRAEIYWVQDPWTGRLAIMPRPRGGDWLEDEVRDWRAARIGLVVCTLTSGAVAELKLAQEAAV